MATSSEYGATSNAIRTANNTAAIGFPQENRRKSAFKSLVSDVADQLGSKEVTDICWHKDVHLSSKERLPLDVLMWLVKHGTFSENEVRPLAQLLKDIHREDLIARVEKFEEEFGN